MLSAVNPRLTPKVGGTNKPLSGSLQRRRYTYRVYDYEISSYITRSRNTNELEFRYTVAKDDRKTNGVSVTANALSSGNIGTQFGCREFRGGSYNPGRRQGPQRHE